LIGGALPEILGVFGRAVSELHLIPATQELVAGDWESSDDAVALIAARDLLGK
jgi:hypothetical protein